MKAGSVTAIRVALALSLSTGGCTGDPLSTEPPEGTLEEVVSGLSSPVGLSAPAGDTERLFVVEQSGRVVIVRDGSVQSPPFLDLTGQVSSGGERGLLGLAFHPSYGANGHLYVNYTNGAGDTRVVRYTVYASDPDVADPSTAMTILAVSQPFPNHNGGHLAFGPDGMLYVGLGDGGSGGDPQGHGQNRATLLGSMLRLDVDGGSPYGVPADNPFVGTAGVAPETWAYGLRNPWRFSFDASTGDLYVADVGQGDIEEISVQPASSTGGENYGWNTLEGSACFNPGSGCDPTGTVLPTHEYDHRDGCSVTGGYVYRGAANPSLVGRYFFADFCSSWIRSFRYEGGVATDLVDHEADFGPVSQVSSFGVDGVGELYVVEIGGTIWRVVQP